ncbi:flagellar basal body rod protein FlgB [Malaciobacter molluscorum LMG 25693]|uniref:Flagellar basal body rod protein FlgB n=1 Tax=Malaciobacter molluscorum LMG 25693 TaxID=870501 RepID=A0A2G1DJ97_9BACT|nr:flagellar basal body rod protein FlgB [Malaciobacter molluscorum]AXX93150.1 flagellar proximal rod protein FlgB [Malaciobacter molluscorum LMG 25693]PHO18406.1 flagellar basal body rod protein FlgB [Malaciobacter molluscorum LMG 25693]RXJ95605.1 flagellar basal body rod protein FlgB [Malaciobacter molluscorum]
MKPSSVTQTLFSQLNFRGDRQKVISSNIANINTPGYKTKDLVFEGELKKADESRLKLYTTDKKHLSSFSEENSPIKKRVVDVKGLEEQNDGNNVNLDTQMSEMAKNKVLFDAIQASIRKDSSLFKSVIEASSKN